MKTLLLIDANSLIHRSFHALPPLTTPDKKPIQAIYGIASILMKLWREARPAYAAALFDRPEPTFRDALYEEYKAQRPEAPTELISQIIEAHKLFEAFGVATFELPGFEADDLIATFAEKFKVEPDLAVVILTGDMDTLQLVEDGRIVARTFKKGVSETTTYDAQSVVARYGVRPTQLIDYKALVGDPSDNIKGVPGIGPKTAGALLKKYGTLQNLFEHLGEEPKFRERFKANQEGVFLAKQLVTLKRNAPIDTGSLAALGVRDSREALTRYFRALGFESLVTRLHKYEGERPNSLAL